MIDIESIKQNYSNMLDNQLISVVKEDGMNLMPEAYAALKDEFQKRNLDLTFFETIEQNKREIHEAEVQRIKDSTDEQKEQLLWDYILSEKESLHTDDKILLGLIERGLDQNDAESMLGKLKEKITEKINKTETQMYIGFAVSVLGLFISLTTYAAASQGGGYYVITYGAVIFGAVRGFKALSQKRDSTLLLKRVSNQ